MRCKVSCDRCKGTKQIKILWLFIKKCPVCHGFGYMVVHVDPIEKKKLISPQNN